jgi:hypothetical protein
MGHFSPSLFIASTFVVLALSAGVMSVGTVPVFVFLSTAPGTPCFCAMVTPGVKSAVTSLPVFVAKARMFRAACPRLSTGTAWSRRG